MHCCLITAPTITEFRSLAELRSEAVQRAALQPQLGILSVASTLESCGDCPDIVDTNGAYLRYAEIGNRFCADGFAQHVAKLAVRSNADLYGFSSICSTYPLSLRVAREVKRMRPYATILFGGPQASVVDVATMTAFPFVDFILRGETEQTLPSLMERLRDNYDVTGVGGLTFRDGGAVQRNANAPVIEDLDQLPAPAYHLSNYLRGSTAASIELGRGCPFSCTFCSTNDFFRRKFRLRSPARVLKDMREIADTYAIRHFDLVHDMFTVDRKRVVGFCDEMLASGDEFTWDCSARTDCVDEELLELMARSGCRGVFFGIEVGSRRMQRVIDKDLDPERAEEMLDIAERLQIRTTASLITGFPEERWDDVRDTLRIFMHSARCAHSHPQINLLAPLAGTPIHATHRHEMTLEYLCSDMSHQGLTQSEQDLDLIRQYPDIFPNFYLIPMKELDRDVLFDLKEFLSMAVECFRWLLGAIDQADDLFLLHSEWRVWRIELRGDLVGSDLRRYYAQKQFRSDFLRFVGDHRLRETPVISALLRAEDLMMDEAWESRRQIGDVIAGGEPLHTDDVPFCRCEQRVLHPEYKLEQIVQSIATRSKAEPGDAAWYAMRADGEGRHKMVEISKWMAAVVELCDGQRSVAEILDRLAYELPEVEEEARSYVFGRLLTGAHAAGFVSVHRPTPLEMVP